MDAANDNPGVIVPPPLIALAAVMLGLALDWFLPPFILRGLFGFLTRVIFGGMLIAAGSGIAIAAIHSFRAARTHVEPWKPATTLVTHGIFGFIRHPMYTAFWLMAFAQALLLPNWIAGLAGLTGFGFLFFSRIRPEERLMEEAFGETYRDYKARTKRVIPFLY